MTKTSACFFYPKKAVQTELGERHGAETMLMYGKEASNQKQEIDRQHYTIPNQRKQRLKDKHCGNVHNRLWNHG